MLKGELSMSSDLYLRGMVVIRFLSAMVELTGAFLMWRFNRIDMAVRINSFLGLVGPIILTTTMLLGVAGMAATKVPLSKILWIGGGVALILWGTTR